jgi:hypothetical protein
MTVLGEDGKSWSTKLERIGKLAREKKEVEIPKEDGSTRPLAISWGVSNN